MTATADHVAPARATTAAPPSVGAAVPTAVPAALPAALPVPTAVPHPVPHPVPHAGLDEAVAAGLRRTTDVLADYLRAQRTGGELVDPAYGSLWGHLADQVGGKPLRPRLTLAAYLGLGGGDVLGAAHLAAAQELVHTAMVVHDDLLDHDEVRRGRPNLAGAYRARLTAEGVVGRAAEDQVLAAGLLGGDLALVSAFGLVVRAPVPADVRVAVVDLLVRGVTTTVGGELLDVSAGLSAPDDVDTLRIAELKTAAYTCAVPLQAGAVLARADERTTVALTRFGTALGTAFQLVDDELGVFGDPHRTGKSVLSDLRSGKRTELLRLAYQRSDDAGRSVLDRHVGREDLDHTGAEAVRTVMSGCGARDALRSAADAAAETARRIALEHLPADLATYLCALTDEMAGRRQ